MAPQGLPAAAVMFQSLCDQAGLRLKSYGSINTPLDFEELARLEPALLIVPTSFKINKTVIELAADRIGAFASISTGTDHVDLRALADAGRRFFHAPGANAESVAEYVVSAAASLLDFRALENERDLRVGIVGYGRIGSRVARMFDLLGFTIQYYDPFVDADPDWKQTSLWELLSSDILTLHVPLTRDGAHPTAGMVDEALAHALSPHTLFMNTSRGATMTQEAFRAVALRGPCVMDVFPVEPPAPWMTEIPRIVTPHVAGYNYEARAGGTRMVALQFAGALGLTEDMVPPIPRITFSHYVTSFFDDESNALKRDPSSFGPRREGYPDRGSLADAHRRGSQTETEAFLFERLFG
ncbi:MAG: hypothetical protein HY042_02850 [Spirochaetia bacterium]|nr:hypothetical protein [Spirochaetia bacterium]